MSEAAAADSSLEMALGHVFRDRELLETALSHPSHSQETDGTRGNERLEFLGDAVLDLVVSRLLYDANPGWTEGDLSRARAALVNQSALAVRARALEVGRYVKLGRSERRSGGESKDSVLANCFEALVAAIYLDAGLEPVSAFVVRAFGADLEQRPQRDAKTRLQEWAHAEFQVSPAYRTVGDSGVEYDLARFTVEVSIEGEPFGQGVGRSKRLAERAAAEEALARRPDPGE